MCGDWTAATTTTERISAYSCLRCLQFSRFFFFFRFVFLLQFTTCKFISHITFWFHRLLSFNCVSFCSARGGVLILIGIEATEWVGRWFLHLIRSDVYVCGLCWSLHRIMCSASRPLMLSWMEMVVLVCGIPNWHQFFIFLVSFLLIIFGTSELCNFTLVGHLHADAHLQLFFLLFLQIRRGLCVYEILI